MTGFIAQTAGGENAVGSTSLQHALRRRPAALRDHVDHQLISIRSSVGSGRSTDEHRARGPPASHRSAIATGKSKDRSVKSLVFLGRAVVLAVLRRDGAAGADHRHRDRRARRASTATCSPSYDSVLQRPEETGFRAGILGSLWLMVTTAVLAIPLGIAAAIYLEEFADPTTWYNRFIEVNLQNLAAVPVDRLRPAGRRRVMALLGFTDNGIVIGGADRAGAADPAGHHHHHARGAAGRAPARSARARSRSGPPSGRPPGGRRCPSAVPGIATGTILGLSRAIGEAAPLLILGIAARCGSTPTAYQPDRPRCRSRSTA